MTVLTETRERFLLAIAAKIPPEFIAEIHFFQPIKQGGVESGVAVIAEARPTGELPGESSAETNAPKHVVYTALYRLTLKGPDRGKWETNIVAEADAPLVTVDVVVRGVQRRSGDVDEVTRLEGDNVRALLAAKTQA